MVGLTPESLSVIVPDTVMETIFPFGGQSLDGCAEHLIQAAYDQCQEWQEKRRSSRRTTELRRKIAWPLSLISGSLTVLLVRPALKFVTDVPSK